MVNWKLNMYKKELAKTDFPPSPEASKFFFHEHPESPFTGFRFHSQYIWPDDATSVFSFKNVRIEAFHLLSLWVLRNSIKTAQIFLFLFALEGSSAEESCGNLRTVEEGDRKFSLIMELSTQVSLQTEKITQLEEVLEEKEKRIQQLEAEQGAFPFQEVKDSPECLREAPIFFNNTITPVVSDEDM